ncbi:MAG TPA: hypothetical protein VM182_07505 [Terriglobia bacterium]|nr:hypothetical protein [Terriglobia bacterium]
MKIGGHGLRDHLRLLAPLFGLIAAVWVLRMVMAMAGTDPSIVRYVSVGVMSAFSGLLAVWLIHFRRFGGYSNVVFATFLLILWKESLIVAAVAFAAMTGTSNIYTAVEYAHRMSHAKHITLHLTLGVGFGTLFGSAMGCALLWLLRRVVPLTHPGHPSTQPR